ncbi:MAG: class I SAM-dependent methyltransferase, partial [Limisphaerales bacterium]
MLDLINRFANGFVAIPVVDACCRRGLFDRLERQHVSVSDLVSQLGANEGHFRIALRLLTGIGWLAETEAGVYPAMPSAVLAKQVPKDIRELIEFSVDEGLRETGGTSLRRWLECCRTGWDGAAPALAELLDGVLLAPLLVELNRLDKIKTGETCLPALEGSANGDAMQAVRDFFVAKEWGTQDAAGFRLAEAGRYLVTSGGALGTVVSYRPMFRRMDDLLFGDCQAVFARDAAGHESHVDRSVNVVASGTQHQTYFTELEEVICEVFDQLPLEEQPRYLADMGCGDGSLLRKLYEVVRTRSARGKALDRHPLRLIGIDFNAKSLEATKRNLADLPHLVMHGDIGDPQRLLLDLGRHGIRDPERILHLRSFLDHDRAFLPPEDQAAVARRASLPYTGLYVARDGRSIPAAAAVQSLVEHLRRWREIVPKYGLTLLELHCLQLETVRRLGHRTESLYFDAFHGFSGQQLCEAPVFLMAAAEAGLFPDRAVARCFPKSAPFTRITLNRLTPRPYTVRHAVASDLGSLEQLEAACVPENLRTSASELSRRVASFPQGQAVLEYEGRV